MSLSMDFSRRELTAGEYTRIPAIHTGGTVDESGYLQFENMPLSAKTERNLETIFSFETEDIAEIWTRAGGQA